MAKTPLISPNQSSSRELASRISWRIAIMAFLGGIGGGVVFPILPALGERLGLSALIVGAILAANRFVRIGVNPLTGSLTDRFGGREVVAIGLFVEAIGTAVYIAALHLSTPAFWFLLGRIIWGVGSSFLFVGAVAAVLAISETRDRGTFTARVRSAISLGIPAGLLVGGLMSDLISPDAAFLTATAVNVVSALAAVLFIPTKRPPHAHTKSGSSRPRLKTWIELLRIPGLGGVWLYNLLVFFAVQGVLLATLVLLVDRRHILIFGLGPQGSAGIMMAIMMLFRAGVSLTIGRVIDYLGHRTLLLIPTVMTLTCGFALVAIARSDLLLIVGLALTGLGTGAIVIPLLALMGDLVPENRRGRATAIYQIFSDIGGTAGPVVGLVIATRYGLEPTFLGLAALFIISLPISLFLMRHERNQLKSEPVVGNKT